MINNSYIEDEIFSQPEIINSLIQKEKSHILQVSEKIRGKYKYIMIAARDTSDNAARYGQYLFQIHNGIPVVLATPSVFSIYNKQPVLDVALVMAISQSGMSPGIVSVLEVGKLQGRPTIAITNNLDSPLSNIADDTIYMNAGVENSVAATKTYTSSLITLALLSLGIARNNSMTEILEKIPKWTQETLKNTLKIYQHMERYRFLEHCLLIGRGFNYCTAFEIALKVKELTGITTAPYSSADFLHGPVAAIHKGYPIIIIAHKGNVYRDIIKVIKKVTKLGAELLIISDDLEIQKFAQLFIKTPNNVPEWISPVINVLLVRF